MWLENWCIQVMDKNNDIDGTYICTSTELHPQKGGIMTLCSWRHSIKCFLRVLGGREGVWIALASCSSLQLSTRTTTPGPSSRWKTSRWSSFMSWQVLGETEGKKDKQPRKPQEKKNEVGLTISPSIRGITPTKEQKSNKNMKSSIRID